MINIKTDKQVRPQKRLCTAVKDVNLEYLKQMF